MLKLARRLLRKLRFIYVHWGSLDKIRTFQEVCLRALITHAEGNIRMYKQLFQECGVTADSVLTLDDLTRLPITSKSTYQARPIDDLIDASQPIRSQWVHTSGSSGKPLSVLVSRLMTVPFFTDFAAFRFYFWEHPFVFDMSSVKCAKIKIVSKTKKNKLFVPVADVMRDVEGVIRQLADFDPEILQSYPSVLLEIARALEQNPQLPRLSIQYVVSTGEMLSQGAREYLEAQLSCKVYNRYGAEEVGAVAGECTEHNGMHINVESVIIEILNEDGTPVQDGGTGRVIITDLLNFNMPFIRYEVGDRGNIIREKCACGLLTPRIFIEGRYSGYLTSGSRKIHHLEIDGALDSFMNQIIQYQVAKVSEKEFEVRVVPGVSFVPLVEERIIDNIKKLTGDDVRVIVSRVSSIPMAPRGKSRIIVDETV